MAVMGVTVLQDGEPIGSVVNSKTVSIEVQNTAESTTVATVSQAATEVAVPTFIANVVVSPTAPAFPFEGQIWIDVS